MQSIHTGLQEPRTFPANGQRKVLDKGRNNQRDVRCLALMVEKEGHEPRNVDGF